MTLIIKMARSEEAGLLERLKWYSASILGLLNHLGGFPSAGRIFQWLGMDEKVQSLLERQESSVREAELAKVGTENETIRPARSDEQDSVPVILIRLIEDSGEVAARLHDFKAQHSHGSADISERIDQVLSLRVVIQELNGMLTDPKNQTRMSGLEEPVRTIGRGLQYTLEDVLEALSTEGNDARWARWIDLYSRMGQTGSFGLPQRLRWYTDTITDIVEDLDDRR